MFHYLYSQHLIYHGHRSQVTGIAVDKGSHFKSIKCQ